MMVKDLLHKLIAAGVLPFLLAAAGGATAEVLMPKPRGTSHPDFLMLPISAVGRYRRDSESSVWMYTQKDVDALLANERIKFQLQIDKLEKENERLRTLNVEAKNAVLGRLDGLKFELLKDEQFIDSLRRRLQPE